jgi:hypothetical protein
MRNKYSFSFLAYHLGPAFFQAGVGDQGVHADHASTGVSSHATSSHGLLLLDLLVRVLCDQLQDVQA